MPALLAGCGKGAGLGATDVGLGNLPAALLTPLALSSWQEAFQPAALLAGRPAAPPPLSRSTGPQGCTSPCACCCPCSCVLMPMRRHRRCHHHHHRALSLPPACAAQCGAAGAGAGTHGIGGAAGRPLRLDPHKGARPPRPPYPPTRLLRNSALKTSPTQPSRPDSAPAAGTPRPAPVRRCQPRARRAVRHACAVPPSHPRLSPSPMPRCTFSPALCRRSTG